MSVAVGSRNLDRIPLRAWRSKVATVAEMRDHGWEVASVCRKCGLTMLVDLELIAQVRGPGVILWNRTAKCRRMFCDGVVDFHAKPVRGRGFEPLKCGDFGPEEPSWAEKRVRGDDTPL